MPDIRTHLHTTFRCIYSPKDLSNDLTVEVHGLGELIDCRLCTPSHLANHHTQSKNVTKSEFRLEHFFKNSSLFFFFFVLFCK